MKVVNYEMDVKGHILSAQCSLFDTVFQLINVYAPSVNSGKKDREDLFQNDLLYFARKNLKNLILGGDWNCTTSQRDCSNLDNNLVSKSLIQLKNILKLKDVWLLTNNVVEYTYIRHNYGSRLDRIYVKDLQHNVTESRNVPVSWSDHNVLRACIKLERNISYGKSYWKLNCSVVTQSIVHDNFIEMWNALQFALDRKQNSVLDWWIFAKSHIKEFFIKVSKRSSQEEYGLLNLLKAHLKEKYKSHYILCN